MSLNNNSPWPGFSSFKNLFVFGDSYSAIGYAANLPPPTKIDRNTVPYNILRTLIYLCTIMPSEAHVYPRAGSGGAVETQVNKNFLEGYAMERTAEGLPWDAADSLFVTWVGINDCAYAQTHEDTLELLFSLQEKLYAAGARVFLFIDVPPIARSPAGVNASSDISATYMNWNSGLRRSVQDFAAAHPDARVLGFSAFDTFNRILDNPSDYGISKKDVSRAGGAVWRDHLHPTSKIHEIFARELVEFLKSVDRADE
ncbi:Glycosyltransferase family 32 protein [Mycena venus]|uniref:Glycosyltransferase family 32 protein n=1 Tax=Mycena venus TaxID=2733690 RepID=A0A8H7D8N2_9AGAR|nr:Glycosyltransferase family 32 protein [Mycena venus]